LAEALRFIIISDYRAQLPFLGSQYFFLPSSLNSLKRSLETCIFPDRWKHSFVISIFKSGRRNDISNYRGIAILSATAKLFKLLLYRIKYEDLKSCLAQRQPGIKRPLWHSIQKNPKGPQKYSKRPLGWHFVWEIVRTTATQLSLPLWPVRSWSCGLSTLLC
jgi:hypothetical protein